MWSLDGSEKGYAFFFFFWTVSVSQLCVPLTEQHDNMRVQCAGQEKEEQKLNTSKGFNNSAAKQTNTKNKTTQKTNRQKAQGKLARTNRQKAKTTTSKRVKNSLKKSSGKTQQLSTHKGTYAEFGNHMKDKKESAQTNKKPQERKSVVTRVYWERKEKHNEEDKH